MRIYYTHKFRHHYLSPSNEDLTDYPTENKLLENMRIPSCIQNDWHRIGTLVTKYGKGKCRAGKLQSNRIPRCTEMGNIPMKSGKLSLQTTEPYRRISERELDCSCPLLQSCNLISFGSVVPESSAGTVSEVWILGLPFYSFIIEYQHVGYSLSSIENQCQNFHTHESAYCLHGYKYTDYQYYTLYSF